MHERPETNNNPTEITTNALGIILHSQSFTVKQMLRVESYNECDSSENIARFQISWVCF